MGFQGGMAGGQALGTLMTGGSKSTYVGAVNPYQVNNQSGLWDMQNHAADQEAASLNNQGEWGMIDAENAATSKARETQQFQSNQAMAYNGSGVMLQGSPLAVLEQTRQLGQQEVNNIMIRGVAQADLLRQKANIVINQGRAAVLGEQAQWGANAAQFNANETMQRISSMAGHGSPWAQALSQLGSMFGNKGGSMFGNKGGAGGGTPFNDPGVSAAGAASSGAAPFGASSFAGME